MNFNRIFFICAMMVGMQMVAMEVGHVVVVPEPGQPPLTALTTSEVGEHDVSLVKRPSFIAGAQDGILKIRRDSETDFAFKKTKLKTVKFVDDTTIGTVSDFRSATVFDQLRGRVSELVAKKDKAELEKLKNMYVKPEDQGFSEIIKAGWDELEQAEKEQAVRIETGSVVADSGVFKASDQSKDTEAILPLSTAAAAINNSTVPLIAVEKPASLVRQGAQLKLDTNPEIQKSTPQPNTSASTASVSLTTPKKPYNWKAWLGIGAGVAAVAATVIWYFWSYQKPIASH